MFPSYLLVLSNPAAYAPIIKKSVQLGQQSSETAASAAGRELVGSTAMAGLLAIVMWLMIACQVIIPLCGVRCLFVDWTTSIDSFKTAN